MNSDLQHRPDRWSASGWRWLPASTQRNYFHRTLLSTTRAPGASLSVDCEHKTLVPDRWSPTGWKFAVTDPADHRYLQHPNKRNFQRRRPGSQSWKGDFRTTSSLAYTRHQFPSVAGSAEVAPVAANVEVGEAGKRAEKAAGCTAQWPTDPQAARFHKKKHLDSGWFRMHLSGGTIR